MSVISPGRHATEQHLRRTEELLRPVGKVLRIPESQQDAATALSGSGPAYVYFLVESMVDAGILLGMSRASALEMVKQAVFGAATMLRESGEHPVILREAVTSPGGTTISAIRELERHGVRAASWRQSGPPGTATGNQRWLRGLLAEGPTPSPGGDKITHWSQGLPFLSTNYAGYGRDWCAGYGGAASAGGYRWQQSYSAQRRRFLTVAGGGDHARVEMTVYRLVHSGDLERSGSGRSARCRASGRPVPEGRVRRSGLSAIHPSPRCANGRNLAEDDRGAAAGYAWHWRAPRQPGDGDRPGYAKGPASAVKVGMLPGMGIDRGVVCGLSNQAAQADGEEEAPQAARKDAVQRGNK